MQVCSVRQSERRDRMTISMEPGDRLHFHAVKSTDRSTDTQAKSTDVNRQQAITSYSKENPESRLTTRVFNDKLCQAIGVNETAKNNS